MGCAVPVRVEADDADVARVRSAIGLAMAYEPHGEFWPMTIGIAPASSAWLTFSSTAACARRMLSTVGWSLTSRRDRGVAEVDDLQVLEHVEVEVLDVARA